MKHLKLQLLIALVLLIGGGLLLTGLIRAQRTSQVVPGPISTSQAAKVTKTSPDILSGQPAELILPSLGLDLPIIPGVYDPATKTWTLSLDKVQYAVMTPPPNTEGGNTFLYGHYRKNVFASLHTIQPNAEAVVRTSNGHSFYYQLAGIRVTSPTDASVFDYQGKPILTIQTCTGLFFQNRQLFTFNLVRVV